MRDENHCALFLLPHLEQFLIHVITRNLVERTKGLVHQEELRVVGKGPRNAHPLPHASGKFIRSFIAKVAQPDQGQQVVSLSALRLASAFEHFERQTNVFGRGTPGHQRGFLEHKSNLPFLARGRRQFAGNSDLTGGDRQEIGDQPKQCGLATAGWADHRDELVLLHVQPQVAQGLDRLRARIRVAHVPYF